VKRLGKLGQADLRVGDERLRFMLGGVVGGDVEREDLEIARLEQRPGASHGELRVKG